MCAVHTLLFAALSDYYMLDPLILDRRVARVVSVHTVANSVTGLRQT